jgi:hypothetical protein
MMEAESKLALGVRVVIRGRPRNTDRPTMAAGHPVSWDAITAGTCLEGASYPHPVFLDGREGA